MALRIDTFYLYSRNTCFLVFVLLCCSSTLFAQEDDSWVAYFNKDSSLTGFKDKNGNIKIPPKFSTFIHANKFQHIITVGEGQDGSFKSYYLTKTGRIVGRDSLYLFDNMSDCKSEGFIRFADKESDMVGMFNRHGNVVIPATYNWLSNVRNGMVMALKGANKVYENGQEHYTWVGGKFLLVDTLGSMLVDSFKNDERLNFYSVELLAEPGNHSIRQYFRKPDGSYLSFIDYQLEFRSWLVHLLDDLTLSSLLDATYKEVTLWDETEGWITKERHEHIKANFNKIKRKLLIVKNSDDAWSLFQDGLNKFIYTDSEKYGKYFDNCGEAIYWQYPVLTIVITNKKSKKQDHFDFLRTENGYKLLSVSMAK